MLSGIIGNEKSPTPPESTPAVAATAAAVPQSQPVPQTMTSSSSRKSSSKKKTSPKSEDDSSPERLKTKVIESIKKNKRGTSSSREDSSYELKKEDKKLDIKTDAV